jgi:hypothetical protein
MAYKTTDYNRKANKLGKPMGWMEDLAGQQEDLERLEYESDEEYKRRMRIKKNRELEKSGKI